MPSRYWLRVLAFGAVGLAALAAIGWGFWHFSEYRKEQANQRQEAATNYTERANQEAYYPCSDVPRRVDRLDCFFREVQTSPDDKKAEYDLKAQQDMAAWALALLRSRPWACSSP